MNDTEFPGYRAFDGLPEVAWDRAQQRAALDFALSQPPTKWVEIAFVKARLLFETSGGAYILPLVLFLYWLLYLRLRRKPLPQRNPNSEQSQLRWRAFILIGIFWFGLLLNTVIFWGDFRFRFPLDSLTAIVTGALLADVIRLVRSRQRGSARLEKGSMV